MATNVNFEHQHARPETNESSDQFIVRLSNYLMQIELSNTEENFKGLKELIVKEQFINSCFKELAVHLREGALETLKEIVKIADQYLEAHGKHVFCPVHSKPPVQHEKEENKEFVSNSTLLHSHKCNGRQHTICRATICPTVRKCFLCGKQGHEACNCRTS